MSRKMKTIGATYGKSTPHESQATIVNPDVGLFDFVTAGLTLTQISKLKIKSNITLDDAKLIAMGEEMDSRHDVLATLEVLGDINGDVARRNHPIMPGTKLQLATSEMIGRYLGFKDSDVMIDVGHLLRRDDVRVVIEKKWFNKHISIMGMTGGGKSNLSKIILEQLEKSKEVRIVIIDPHGEYDKLDLPVDNIQGDPDRIEMEFVIERLYQLTKKDAWTVPRLIEEIIDISKSSNRIRKMKLSPLKAFIVATSDYYVRGGNKLKPYLQSAIKTETIISTVRKWIVDLDSNIPMVINLKGMGYVEAEAIVQIVAEAILDLGKSGKGYITFIDEVHNYCPQKRKALSKDAIINLISEGRKFDCGVIIMSQRPAKVDKDIISQCNTKFCLKLTNENDIKQVRGSTEYATRTMFKEVQVLQPGEGLLSSPWIKRPVFIKIDEFKDDTI